MKQTISVLVENQAGVLNRITNLFSRRAFNIESLAVGVTDDPSISRITIIVDSGNSVVEQVEKQLNKLIDVIKVRTLDENKMIARELMIVKVSCTTKTRTDIMNLCQIMGAKIADLSSNTMTLELSDTGDRLEQHSALFQKAKAAAGAGVQSGQTGRVGAGEGSRPCPGVLSALRILSSAAGATGVTSAVGF